MEDKNWFQRIQCYLEQRGSIDSALADINQIRDGDREMKNAIDIAFINTNQK
jgi:hypothetical protein